MALTESVYVQISQDLFPLLLLVGKPCSGATDSGSIELQFAFAMPRLRRAAEKLSTLTELIVNMFQQLGALCSEQTRKSTVISGMVNTALRIQLGQYSVACSFIHLDGFACTLY